MLDLRTAESEALRAILNALRGRRYRVSNEAELQVAVADVLGELNVGFRREAKLDGASRIDFLFPVVDDPQFNVGLEIKIACSVSALLRQLHRYSLSDKLDQLVFFTSSRRLAIEVLSSFPDRLVFGKRLHIVDVSRF